MTIIRHEIKHEYLLVNEKCIKIYSTNADIDIFVMVQIKTIFTKYLHNFVKSYHYPGWIAKNFSEVIFVSKGTYAG